MNYNQFSNLSCCEEFEIQSTLTGISKIDALKEIGHQIDDYYFFISDDGVFNWFDLNGNHIKDPSILKELKEEYIPKTITKCVIPDSVTRIDYSAFAYCKYLKTVDIPDNVTRIDSDAFWQCESLETITIPDNTTYIGVCVFYKCTSLKEIIFKGKTLDEVKRIKRYPFGIKCESIIKCEI